jgi:hypothetical protein
LITLRKIRDGFGLELINIQYIVTPYDGKELEEYDEEYDEDYYDED